jgi:eukaryotic-like serine/threonine-protein kinase
MDPAEQSIYLGATLGGRYRIEAAVGTGNFSGVFRATDETTGNEVAVKILSFRSSASPEARLEFEGERDLLEMLAGYSNVVAFLDSGRHTLSLATPGGVHLPVDIDYLVVELAEGSLAEVILHRHRLPWKDRLSLFRGIAKGVHQMHLARCVHRDVKSDNGLVFAGPVTAKVADLGRSRNTQEPPRFHAHAYAGGRGDLRFAPPEYVWLCGSEEPQEMATADLYLLGSLLFEFATGVGFTAVALGDPRAIMATVQPWSVEARADDLENRRHELREQFAPVYDLFMRELPPHLRGAGRELLAQLTHPDPIRRLPPNLRWSDVRPWRLDWLLRRIDTLLHIDHAHAIRSKLRSKRKARRP